jgi:SM-20-related protein
MTESFEFVIEGLVARGYAVLDDFLRPEEVRSLSVLLLQKFEQGQFRQAGIGKGTLHTKNLQVRGDHIHWLSENSPDVAERQYLERIGQFMRYLNTTCYTGLRSFEFHYALYPVGAFYRRHLDRFSDDDSRQYSVVCYLNQNWKPAMGGELVIYLEGETVSVLPQAGRLVVFRSGELEHEVRLARQPRLSITGWLKR